jgi:serine/threonine protein kinase
METQTWRKGDIVGDGRFEILQELGAGGFGITYLAYDHVKKQQIAIKTLNSNQQREGDFAVRQKKFEDEGFTLRGFRHPHIVRVYEKVDLNGLLGYVMEYIPGQNLEKYVKNNGRLSEIEALLYIDQISLALEYVHQDNFLHRDVNPRNIMLRQDSLGLQKAVLIDFGLAREFVDLQPIYLSNTHGSELYKPIEQYEKRGIFGPQTDIYALAVTLYYLLNGAPLGSGKNWIAFTSISRKRNHEIGKGEESDQELWADLINVGVSARILAAIQAGMSIEPEDRPKNMMEFRSLLGLFPITKISSMRSHVEVVGSVQKQPTKPLLLVDSNIANVWGVPPETIHVYQNRTLSSLPSYKDQVAKWNNVVCIDTNDLFLSELTFIDVDDALPGGFPIRSNQPLMYNNYKITPLLPFNPLLLEYFTPEDFMERVWFEQNGQDVLVVLNLPLSGMNIDVNSQPQEYQLVREYTLNEQNAIEDVPVLELWPNLKIPNWQDYYAFYFDDNDTFKVSFCDAQESHTYSDRNGDYMITRLSDFPTHINCQRRGCLVGFILLNTLIEQKLSDTWVVGVDFGTSFTNVYVNCKGKAEPLQLENLHLKITASNVETRQPVLFESFIPEVFVPSNKPLPLANVLTHLGATGNEKKRVLYDGRIYVPDRINFHPESNHLETDLGFKWSTISRLFLEHLVLMVSALAAKARVQEIQWSISYPSAFSQLDINTYARLWQNLTGDLQQHTGINHVCPEMGENAFCTDSLAVAQYFVDREEYSLVNGICIEIGATKSDISIWQDNTVTHQCLIKFGGHNLLHHLLKQRPVLIARWFKRPTEEWSDLVEDKLNAKIDSLLYHESERFLIDVPDILDYDRDFQGLIQLMAIGTAGMHYYIGLILKALASEGKYVSIEIPSVYIGGHSSRLLDWIATGVFTDYSGINELCKRMIADSSGLTENDSVIRNSRRPGDEVACGLVLNKSKLKGLKSRDIKDPLIAGENCRINGQNVGFDQRMSVAGDDITLIEAPPQLDRLIDFINSFNEGIKDLGIEEEIKPFSQYRKDSGLEAGYSEELFDKTMTELRSTLININNGDGEQLQVEPPFILGLKALMKVLAREWSGK